MGMRMPPAKSAPCTSMPMMVAMRNLRFCSTRTCSMGRSIASWRRKNSTSATTPTAAPAMASARRPYEPMVDRPYRRPPKPNDDRTTDGTSRLTSLFVSPPFSSTNAPMSTTTAESAVMM